MRFSVPTTTQDDFAAALTDISLPVPDGLTAWNGPRPKRRFGVYRDNVAIGLTGALASRFPVAEKIVGKEFFAAMSHEFIRLCPPRSPLLLAYGDDLADFVERFEPARDVAYLADVIRLEAARGRAYHAADAAPLQAERLAAIDPDRLAELTFLAHPSLSVLTSPHPIVTIWAMNAGEMELRPIEDWSGEDVLVVRPGTIVEVHRLPAGGATFLSELAKGAALVAALEHATEAAPDFDLSSNLAGALQAGAFIDVRWNGAGDNHE
ncbi:putative DNA-binding protein [Rhizobium azibense]|uniref:Putative DNA-binding protein n=1 Tax=Rhizobium azibense TaxID=1136135 RepID=A0A4R3RV99_9HYPH|nr:putative DNA-binding protein [Rhizobium azibense]